MVSRWHQTVREPVQWLRRIGLPPGTKLDPFGCIGLPVHTIQAPSFTFSFLFPRAQVFGDPCSPLCDLHVRLSLLGTAGRRIVTNPLSMHCSPHISHATLLGETVSPLSALQTDTPVPFKMVHEQANAEDDGSGRYVSFPEREYLTRAHLARVSINMIKAMCPSTAPATHFQEPFDKTYIASHAST